MRNFKAVIDEIVALIPHGENVPEDDDHSELVNHLNQMNSDWFAAPEIISTGMLWIAAATQLEEWLDREPKEKWPEWKWRVLSTFTGTLRQS